MDNDEFYIDQISHKLELFKHQGNNAYNFRCPICGDSDRSKTKARGYLYPGKQNIGGYIFKCHNCQSCMSLPNLIKELDRSLYQKLVFDNFKSGGIRQEKKNEKLELPSFKTNLKECYPINDDNGIFKSYLDRRKIPRTHYSDVFAIHSLKKFIEANYKRYSEQIDIDDKRIGVPFTNRQGHIVGISCRSLNPSSTRRYIILKDESDESLVWNWHRVNLDIPVIVTEGQFDAMFLINSISVAGSGFSKIAKKLKKHQTILVFDNESRNYSIKRTMKNMLNQGWNVCIWPKDICEKDINDMILSGMSQYDISKIIMSYYQMPILKNKLEFANWVN